MFKSIAKFFVIIISVLAISTFAHAGQFDALKDEPTSGAYLLHSLAADTNACGTLAAALRADDRSVLRFGTTTTVADWNRHSGTSATVEQWVGGLIVATMTTLDTPFVCGHVNGAYASAKRQRNVLNEEFMQVPIGGVVARISNWCGNAAQAVQAAPQLAQAQPPPVYREPCAPAAPPPPPCEPAYCPSPPPVYRETAFFPMPLVQPVYVPTPPPVYREPAYCPPPPPPAPPPPPPRRRWYQRPPPPPPPPVYPGGSATNGGNPYARGIPAGGNVGHAPPLGGYFSRDYYNPQANPFPGALQQQGTGGYGGYRNQGGYGGGRGGGMRNMFAR